MNKYKELQLDIKLPDFLQDDINMLLNFLNNGGDPDLSDIYRSTIRNDINCCEHYDFDDDVGNSLRKYYVYGGIFEENEQ